MNDTERKLLEQKWFEKLAQGTSVEQSFPKSGAEAVAPVFRTPYTHLEEWLFARCNAKRVLDYGCGQGNFSLGPAKYGAHVIGVDISSTPISIANARASAGGVSQNTRFILGDCESLPLQDNTFDIVMSCGVLSYLRLDSALSEMARVLKADGQAIIIETLGHNPLLNIKRSIETRKGHKTLWHKNHLLKLPDFKSFGQHFAQQRIEFFDFSTLAMAPFFKHASTLASLMAKLDGWLLRWPPLQRWSFKVLIELSGPQKS